MIISFAPLLPATVSSHSLAVITLPFWLFHHFFNSPSTPTYTYLRLYSLYLHFHYLFFIITCYNFSIEFSLLRLWADSLFTLDNASIWRLSSLTLPLLKVFLSSWWLAAHCEIAMCPADVIISQLPEFVLEAITVIILGHDRWGMYMTRQNVHNVRQPAQAKVTCPSAELLRERLPVLRGLISEPQCAQMRLSLEYPGWDCEVPKSPADDDKAAGPKPPLRSLLVEVSPRSEC